MKPFRAVDSRPSPTLLHEVEGLHAGGAADRTAGVLNDNNYPFSSGRAPGQPDANEFIIIRLDRPPPR